MDREPEVPPSTEESSPIAREANIHPKITYPVPMEENAPGANATKESSFVRRGFDKKILLAFAVLASISVIVPSASYFVVEDFSGFQVASGIVGGLTFSFLIVGIESTGKQRSQQ